MKFFPVFASLLSFLLGSLSAEYSWIVKDKGYGVMVKKEQIGRSEFAFPEYVAFYISISQDGALKRINDMNFLLYRDDEDTEEDAPFDLRIWGEEFSNRGIQSFNFDDEAGVIEIVFKGREGSFVLSPAKLTITRGRAIRSIYSDETYSCNATLSYQSKFIGSEWGFLRLRESEQTWVDVEYRQVEEIVFPSVHIIP